MGLLLLYSKALVDSMVASGKRKDIRHPTAEVGSGLSSGKLHHSTKAKGPAFRAHIFLPAQSVTFWQSGS